MPRSAGNLYESAAATVRPGDTPAPPPGVLVAGHFREGPRYRVHRGDGTRDWLLTCTVAGAGVYRLDGGRGMWRAQPGELWLLLPGVEHDYGTDASAGRWEFTWTHFVPRPGWMEWLRWPAAAPGLLWLRLAEPRTEQRVRRAWERLLVDARDVGALGQDLALNALEEILLLAARLRQAQAGSAAAFGAADARVRDTLEYVAAHPGAQHSVAALAARVSLSASRLGHLCKAETGMGLVEAVTALRLREAARLLAFTNRSVAEIAGDVGFASPFYFSRRFAARYGAPPRVYRARLRGQRASDPE